MDPKRIHQIDQESGPLHELAMRLRAYHRSLLSQGFTDSEALQITIAYQDSIVRSVPWRPDHGR